MQAPNSPVRYKLSAPVHAVKLAEHPGSSLRNPTEELVDIPADVVVELETRVASRSGLVNVLWDGQAFSVYYEDLQEKAQMVTPAAM
jgi:hypothetical protein